MNKKLVICVSGGLDSLGAYHFARLKYCPRQSINFDEEVALLMFENADGGYSDKEWKIALDLYPLQKMKIVSLRGYEAIAKTDDHVVLGRNAMIASVAAAIAPMVWIVGTKYEDNEGMYDKNSCFWLYMTAALTQACGYKRKEKTLVFSPFQGDFVPKLIGANYGLFPAWEKHDIIKFLEDNRVTSWRQTTSCFHPTLQRCGECPVCGKRFVYEKIAELDFGIKYSQVRDLVETYSSSPLKNKYLLETWQKMEAAIDNWYFVRYPLSRILLYCRVLQHYGYQDFKSEWLKRNYFSSVRV